MLDTKSTEENIFIWWATYAERVDSFNQYNAI